MPISNFVVAALIGAGALAAQALPELRTEAVPAGSVFHVKNVESQALTAYLIELVDYPGSSYTLFEDEAMAPGAEKAIRVTNMTVGATPEYVKITAAVYADGKTAGDAAKAAIIVGRRKAVLETVRELIARLEKAKAAGTAAGTVAGELRAWADSLPQVRARRMTTEVVNAAAQRETIVRAAARVEGGSVDEVLAELRAMAGN
jgi:hypothetical protein